MKICFIVEGSYPYITGGVASWIQMLIKNFPEHEFIIYAIGAEEKNRGKFAYTLPSNVSAVKEVFIDSVLQMKGTFGKRYRMKDQTVANFSSLLTGEGSISWNDLLGFMHSTQFDTLDFFMSEDFFKIIQSSYVQKFSTEPFTEYFWTVRSMLLPMIYILKQEIPQADLYHSVSTGYAGALGSMAAFVYNKPFILTEHGIYSREREEEIIKANWIRGCFKDIWIQFFHSTSRLTYEKADRVYSLFERNKDIQVELGCEESKIKIIPNGIDPKQFQDLEPKPHDDSTINIGAVLRVVPIKDLQTLINSFYLVKKMVSNSRLYIMGPTDEDEDYFLECQAMVKDLGLEQDVIFTGKINVRDYLGKMDILVLSSISEAQPLAIMEGMACSIPFVATDVGDCKGLIYGDNDSFGKAGIVVPMMDHKAMASALIILAKDPNLRKTMGTNGYKRVSSLYSITRLIGEYRDVYHGMGGGRIGRNRF